MISRLFGSKNTWSTYQDMIGDKKLSVRVDTKYVGTTYLHTYYVQVKYSEETTIALPSKTFLMSVANLEDRINAVVQKVCGEKVVHLGCATFGGSSYIVYASNYDIKWLEMVSELIGEKVEGGTYLNDNMGYYNRVLYPEYLRK